MPSERLPRNLTAVKYESVYGGVKVHYYLKIRYRDTYGHRHAIVRKCEPTPEAVRRLRADIEVELRDMRMRETFGRLLANLFQLMRHNDEMPQG